MRTRTGTRPPADREAILAAAIRDGKIAAGRRAEYARMYDANPDAIRRLLTGKVSEGGLMPGLVPPTETGGPEEYDASWLSPAERAQLDRRRTQAATAPARPAAASAATSDESEYDDGWLTPAERGRISAAKAGHPPEGPVQFEDDAARHAAGAAGAARVA